MLLANPPPVPMHAPIPTGRATASCIDSCIVIQTLMIP